MTKLDIFLPDDLMKWVESRAQTGNFSDESSYIQNLIRKDQQQQATLTAFRSAVSQGSEGGSAGSFNKSPSGKSGAVQSGIPRHESSPI
jgi:antitoxin ParD1/3/4